MKTKKGFPLPIVLMICTMSVSLHYRRSLSAGGP
ncbi:Loki-CTERM sorting domain-containing protein [Peribacillus muralis]